MTKKTIDTDNTQSTLLAENDFLELHTGDTFTNRSRSILIHHKIQYDARAAFAMNLLEKWGLVMGKEDGEDSAGRQKIKLMPPDEVVAHAFEISEQAFAEVNRRGWSVAVSVADMDKKNEPEG